MAELALQGVSKRFGQVLAVDGVDLAIAHGEFVVLVGPSGCGKSTTLRMISGLESVTAGRVLIGGRDVTNVAPARRGVAMVFQSYALFPHMTAAQNIGFGLRLAKVPKAEIARRVAEVAATLQIEELLGRYPRELSGGQRQRVAIGRSIIRDPQVFLFDEPLSNLDAALRVRMRLEIARLRDRLDATMVYVTHDQTEAMTLADRIVVFNHGRIEQLGAPDELYAPARQPLRGRLHRRARDELHPRPDRGGQRRRAAGARRPGVAAGRPAARRRTGAGDARHPPGAPLHRAGGGGGLSAGGSRSWKNSGRSLWPICRRNSRPSRSRLRSPSSPSSNPETRCRSASARDRFHLFDESGDRLVSWAASDAVLSCTARTSRLARCGAIHMFAQIANT